jgi:signal transduction histidine kinase
VQPASIRFLPRALGVVAAALLLVGIFSQTTLYPRLIWWFEDSLQPLLGSSLPMDHIVAFDVDEESMQRLQPELGAWPYSRDVYARAARFLADHGARAVAFDILFSEPRQGDDALAVALDRRSVLAAVALPFPLQRSPAYHEELKRAAISDAARGSGEALAAQAWPDLTLPLPKFTSSSHAKIGVVTVVTDEDGIVRRLPLLHRAYGEVLPSMALAALLAAELAASPEVTAGELRLGPHTWPLDATGSVLLRYPSNAAAVPVVPFFQLAAAAAGAQGNAHIGDLVRGKIVFLGSSSAVLGDFAYTPAGRLPGLHLNALFTELLLSGGVRRPSALWLDILLLALALAIPLAMVGRDTSARPSEFLIGLGAIVLVVAGAGVALLAAGQSSRWLFATLTAVTAQVFALVAWLFTLYQDKQRLFYEKLSAQEANRMKTEFLNHMTHELRTPITAIMGFNKVNQFTDDLGREQRVHNSEIVARNCEHLLALVNNNLDLARIEAGQLAIERRPTDVPALLDDVISTVRIMAEEKGIALRLEIEGLPRTLLLEVVRLRQILYNLLGNAVKFTERGEVVLEVRWDAGTLQMSVSDTGIGIHPENLDRVFEPFARVAGSRATGTGLGLTITRKLVELMEGTIRVRSAPGRGTAFEVRIPSAEVASPTPQHPETPPAALPPLSGRVLVAEDVEHLRSLVELYMRKLGLECRTVGNGFEAVEAALTGEFDVVLMDLEMPVMDGFEAARVLRERGYQRPIIALTAHQDDLEIERARREGCNSVLNKPISIEQLRGVLGPLLAVRGISRATAAQS